MAFRGRFSQLEEEVQDLVDSEDFVREEVRFRLNVGGVIQDNAFRIIRLHDCMVDEVIEGAAGAPTGPQGEIRAQRQRLVLYMLELIQSPAFQDYIRYRRRMRQRETLQAVLTPPTSNTDVDIVVAEDTTPTDIPVAIIGAEDTTPTVIAPVAQRNILPAQYFGYAVSCLAFVFASPNL